MTYNVKSIRLAVAKWVRDNSNNLPIWMVEEGFEVTGWTSEREVVESIMKSIEKVLK